MAKKPKATGTAAPGSKNVGQMKETTERLSKEFPDILREEIALTGEILSRTTELMAQGFRMFEIVVILAGEFGRDTMLDWIGKRA